jgi:NAD(P)-dependent dehydrogenase (short-subunit alcohol dehydrogenase family)
VITGRTQGSVDTAVVELDALDAHGRLTGIAANLVAQHRAGAVVNIGSMWAHQAVAATPSSANSMAKAGLHSLTTDSPRAPKHHS